MSSPWLTVFDHRFIEPGLTNCRHYPGKIEVSQFAPEIKAELTAEGFPFYYARISSLPPRWIRYSPASLFPNITGLELDLSVRLTRYIHLGYSFVLAQSDGWEYRIQDNGRIEIVSRGQSTGWDGFQHNSETWFDLQWSWRINGQSLLRVNGELVSVLPDVGAGRYNVMSYLWIGSNVIDTAEAPDDLSRGSRPFFSADVSLIRLRLLTEERVKKYLDNQIPLTEADIERVNKCKDAVDRQLQEIMLLLRDTMSAAVKKETKAWVKEDSGSPISRSASVLHKHAREVALAAIGYLNGNDEDFSRFEANARKFFKLLSSLVDRKEFTARLLKVLNSDDQVSDDCKKILNDIRTRNAKHLKRVETLKSSLVRMIEQTLRIKLDG